MKQMFFFTCCLVFAASQIIAQTEFNIGVIGGINSSKITQSSSEFSSGSLVKMHVGAFARYGGVLYVQPEAYFSDKGSKMTSLDGTVTKFNLNDVDIPVLLGVKLFKRKNMNLRVMTGPVFCFVVSKDIVYQVRLYSPFDLQCFKDSYLAYQYGVGIDIGKITLDARMEKGIGIVYEPVGANYRTTGFINSKNNTLMMTFGYRFF